MSMKSEIKKALESVKFEFQGSASQSETSCCPVDVYTDSVQLFNSTITLEAKVGVTTDVTVTTPKGQDVVSYDTDTDALEHIAAGEETIVDVIYSHFATPPSKKKRKKKNKADIKEEQRSYLPEWSQEEQECILDMVADYRGYDPDHHWGRMAVEVISKLGRSNILDPIIASGLIDWRAAMDVFASCNTPNFELETNFPSRESYNAAMDSNTLGPVLDTIESVVAVNRNGERGKVVLPRVVYVVEMLINIFNHFGDKSQLDIEDPATDEETTIRERIRRMVEEKNPLREQNIQEILDERKRKAQGVKPEEAESLQTAMQQ